ncbi:MAG: FHA domain-containing protein, partial [Myxococcales bacterium]|nr:FHA domain-containing protein [Myxococcales bacterium]
PAGAPAAKSPEPRRPSAARGTGYERGTASAPLTCDKCDATIPDGYSFCGVCGTPRKSDAEAPPKEPVAVPTVGHLALIDDLGNESVRYPLQRGDNSLGRAANSSIRFESDGLLAELHCVVAADDPPFRLRPLDFCNGTYLRISTPVELQHGDIVRVGQEVLRFERTEEIAPEISAKTGRPLRVGCPTPRGVWGRLCQIGMARQVANAYLLSHRDVFLGRERGDILFPKDGFVSGSHAVISERGGRVYLKDLGSSNGTFLRVKREIALRSGDLLLLGRNLLRVHVGA